MEVMLLKLSILKEKVKENFKKESEVHKERKRIYIGIGPIRSIT